MTDAIPENDQWVPPEHGVEKGALQKRVARGLTWTFVDMTNDSGKIALIWGKAMASTPFKAVR